MVNGSRQNYYLIAGLPELFFVQEKSPFRVVEFRAELHRQLKEEDYRQLFFIFLPFDNSNFLQLLAKEEQALDPRGNFSANQWEEALQDPSRLLPFQRTFLAAYREQSPLAANQSWEMQLTTLFYDYVLEAAGPFLQRYFAFERDLRNLLVGISGRTQQQVVDPQYAGQYPLTDMLKKSHARDFGLANEYPYLEKLLQLEELADIRERERGIDRLRWNFIEELNTFNYFSLEVILGYTLQLMILERWTGLDASRGEELLLEQLAALTENIEFAGAGTPAVGKTKDGKTGRHEKERPTD